MPETKSLETMRLRTIGVPLTDFEARRFDLYVERTGMKKKAVARIALLEYLDRQEAQS